MNRIRTLLQFLVATMLVAFALPSVAAVEKLYTVAVDPQSGPGPYRVIITNDPSGNSNVNSLWFETKQGNIPNTVRLWVAGKPYPPSKLTPATPPHTRVEFVNIPGYKPGLSATIAGPDSQNQAVITGPATGLGCINLAVFTGNTLGGTAFTLKTVGSYPGVGCDALLACGDPPSTHTSGQNTTRLTRLQDKTGGSTCSTPVGFNVTFSGSDRTVKVTWDEATYPSVMVKLDVTWPFELADPITTLPKLTLTSWESDSLGNPIKVIPSPACRTSKEPPYTPTPPSTAPQSDPDYAFPLIHGDAVLPDGTAHYYRGSFTRVCTTVEAFVVQAPGTSGCPANTPNVGCLRVTSIMLFNGDPIVSRDY